MILYYVYKEGFPQSYDTFFAQIHGCDIIACVFPHIVEWGLTARDELSENNRGIALGIAWGRKPFRL